MQQLFREIPAKCVYCGAPIEQTEEKNYQVKMLGQTITMPLATVGRCAVCRAVNYAFQKKVMVAS